MCDERRDVTAFPTAGRCSACARTALTVCALAVPTAPTLARFAAVIADEMVTNGCIVETNKANVLKPILLLEKTHGK